ncbi:basic leucine zipper 9-like [Forsythia ovata]|uniref:Basic leucine zipper 9-like n=1 Tax=Forsythia ovata TaxID=205694 RepID=A0ABD1WEL7_9LAMI
MSILDRVKFLARKINFSEHFQLHCNLMVKSIYHFSANSPSSATKPKGQDNQSAGASSDSSLQQLDEYDLEIEAGSCEQSTYHIDIKRYKKYGIFQTTMINDYQNWSTSSPKMVNVLSGWFQIGSLLNARGKKTSTFSDT